MKTHFLILIALILVGSIVSSCQKESEIFPSGSESTFEAEKAAMFDDSDDNHWYADPIRNDPDPFRDVTTITYKLERSARVSLVVSHPNFPRLTYLVNGNQRAGMYQYDFDATGMPSGKYYARLKINGVVSIETMIKGTLQDNDNTKEQ